MSYLNDASPPFAEYHHHLVEAKIAHNFEIMLAALTQIPLPPAHCWKPAALALTWFGHDIIRSTIAGASIHARPCNGNTSHGFHAEVRLFWNRVPATRPSLNHVRAILWASQGAAISSMAPPLLAAADACYLSGETIAQVLHGIQRQLAGALSRFVQDEPVQ